MQEFLSPQKFLVLVPHNPYVDWILHKVKKLFVLLIVWAGAKQSRSPGAEQPTQVRVYQIPVGVDGLVSLA